MTREEAKNIVRGITDKIEATTDIDDWAEFWGFTRDDYEEFLEMPIKLLEQEPCEDCVSRKDVINYIRTLACDLSYWSVTDEVVKHIEALPSVTPTQKWIPVSERLPEEETDVLICNSKSNIEVSRGSVFDDGTWEWYTSGWHFGEVVAWMPLPKPYKAERRE